MRWFYDILRFPYKPYYVTWGKLWANPLPVPPLPYVKPLRDKRDKLHYKMAPGALFVVVVSLIAVNFSLAARIAGFSGTPSGSHYFTIKTVMEELSSRGHEVGCNWSSIKSQGSGMDEWSWKHAFRIIMVKIVRVPQVQIVLFSEKHRNRDFFCSARKRWAKLHKSWNCRF